MKRNRLLVGTLICGMAILATVLVGCSSGDFAAILGGSSGLRTKFIIVEDDEYYRVLLFPTPVSNNQAATIALGQPDLTSSSSNTTQAGFDWPSDATGDADGNVWVVDYSACRVLEFKPPFTTGMNASVVIGQSDFTSSNCTATQSGFEGPSGATFDASGNLWVLDYIGSRILEFKPPFSNGMNASLVLGQPDFTSDAGNTTAAGLNNPWVDLAFDNNGNLWVSDYGNSRVVGYAPPFSNGMAASVVLGQPNFTSSGTGTTATTLNYPYGLAVDSSGNLWVADYSNNRVLEYKPPFSTGMAASVVLGQTDMTSSGSSTTATGFDGPADPTFDTSGNLYVADYSNNRTVMFIPPFSTGMSSTTVLGQPNLTSSSCNAASATTFCYPYGVGMAVGK